MIPILSALLLATQAGFVTPPQHTDLHPAQVGMYIEIPQIKAAIADYPAAPLFRLMSSDALSDLMQGISDGEAFDWKGMLRELLDEQGMGELADGLIASLDGLERLSFSTGDLEQAYMQVLTETARREEAELQIAGLSEALELHLADSGGVLPASLSELEGLEPDQLTDPWDHPLAFEIFDGGTDYRIFSLGADGQPGGTGIAADVGTGEELGDEHVFGLGEFELRLWLEFSSEVQTRGAVALLQELGAIVAAEQASPSPGLRWGDVPAVTDTGLPCGWRSSGKLLGFFAGQSFAQTGFQRAGELGEDGSLSSAPDFVSARGRLGGHRGTPLILSYAVQRSPMRLWRGLFDMIGGDSPEKLAALYEEPATPLLWRLEMVPEGFVAVSCRKQGPGQSPFAGQPYDSSLLELVPHDAMGALATTLDGFGLRELLAEMLATFTDLELDLHAQHEPEGAEPLLGKVETWPGTPALWSVLDQLGPGVVAYTMPLKGIGLPQAYAWVDLADPEAFDRALDDLIGIVSEENSGWLEVKRKPYRKVPVTTFSLSGELAAESPVPLTPSLAVYEGRLLVSANPMHLKRELKRLIKGDKPEDASGEPGAVPEPPATPLFEGITTVGGQPLPASPVWLGYMDWGLLIEDGLELAQTFAGMFFGDEMPFVLPEPNEVSAFFEPTVRVGWFQDGWYHTRREASFGPEVFVGAVAFLGVSSVMSFDEDAALEGPAVAAEPASPAERAREQTEMTLGDLRTGLAIFRLENGRYPRRLVQLLEPSQNFPEGFLGWEEIPQDGWNGIYYFDPSEDGASYQLWSAGPDGIDQRGEGDDILVES